VANTVGETEKLWHLEPPGRTPSQVVEAAECILAERISNADEVDLATLSFSYIRREWWITFCRKEDEPDQSVLELSLKDDSTLSIVGKKWENQEWQWSE
jgi:hypothetical protein